MDDRIDDAIGASLGLELPRARRRSNTGPPPRVLFVAGSSPASDRTAITLGAGGVTVERASSGDQALSLFAEHSPDAVVVDAALAADAEYTGGLDVCEKLQALPGGTATPILVLMADGDMAGAAAGYRAGAADCLVPPLDVRMVGPRLEHQIRAARGFHDARESGRRLDRAHRLAHLAEWNLDLTSQRFRWAAGAAAVLGVPEGAEPGAEALLRWVHPADRPAVERALAEPAAHRLEYRIVTPEGREVSVSQEAEIVLDDLDGSIRLVGVSQDISELRRAERRIEEMAYLDNLTGLPNRAFLHRYLEIALASARRESQRLAVLALDLDLFKRVNDTLGHAAGDALLKEVAHRIRGCLRNSDAAAHSIVPLDLAGDPTEPGLASRLGGDEFVVVLNRLGDNEDAVVVARRIAERLAQPYLIDGHDVSVSSSIGIASFPEDGDSNDALLERADAAMYEAKARGRNTFQFFSKEIQERARRRVEVESGLRALLAPGGAPGAASAHGSLLLHYQPIISVPRLRVTGVEALVRWMTPAGELVPPADFIGVAEDCGLIERLGDWVLWSACRQAAAWRVAGRPLRVAVNVSARQLNDRLVATLGDLLRDLALPPGLLEIEVTEAVAMASVSTGRRILERVRELGVRVALDDFGTGYSSLSALADLPIDSLKIDRTLIAAVGSRDRTEAIVLAMLQLASQIGIAVVAEGVETREQYRRLARNGPLDLQGYLFARPMPAEAVGPWLAGSLATIAAATCDPETAPSTTKEHPHGHVTVR